VTLSRKHGQCMMEDITPALHPLIHPPCTMALFVQVNGKRLSAAVVDRVNECDIELVGVLREVVCA